MLRTAPPNTLSTCGNCPARSDHADLRGHQPDPARGHGAPVAQVARRSPFALVSGYLLGGASAARIARRACRGGPGDPVLCPLFPVGSRRFRAACWIRADPWAITVCVSWPGGHGQNDRLSMTALSSQARRNPDVALDPPRWDGSSRRLPPRVKPG